MGDVIKTDFEGRREDASASCPYMRGPVVCIECRHEWEGVAPEGVTQLECPECGTEKGVWVYPFMNQKRPLWRCACGNDFFVIHDDRFLCARCGMEQRFDDD